jgi:hypothetical protein
MLTRSLKIIELKAKIMAQIPPIDDSYIDDIIKAQDVFNPGLNKTQGVKLRALVKLLRDRLEQEIAAGGSSIPAVATGEKVVTQKPDGTHCDYDLMEQVLPASALSNADFSTGIAAATGVPGQVSYDSNYRYDCIGINQWRRSALNGSMIDLYLPDIDDSNGDKTSLQLQAAYPASVIGQQVWSVNNLYIKKTEVLWYKLPATLA